MASPKQKRSQGENDVPRGMNIFEKGTSSGPVVVAEQSRKSCPSIDERMVLADGRLTKLNALCAE